jgi:hypothetical protein
MDGIDFQKNLSRGSLFRDVDLVKFASSYVVAWIAPTFVDGYTRNFGKLSVIVKAWMGYCVIFHEYVVARMFNTVVASMI